MTKGHKIREWHYNKDTNKVYRLKGMVMDVYEPSLVRSYPNRLNCWMRLRINVPLVNQGKICSMKDVALAVKNITLHLPWPPSQTTPSTFWEVIRGWGNTWMWDNLSIMGDLDWTAVSIADNSCVAISTPLHLFWSAPKAEGGLWVPLWSIHPMLAAIVESF
jgi:hypothetical protein